MKLTGWYRGDQKPVRVGVYQRQYGMKRKIIYSYWNGRNWGINCIDENYALFHKNHISSFPELPWRGVAK